MKNNTQDSGGTVTDGDAGDLQSNQTQSGGAQSTANSTTSVDTGDRVDLETNNGTANESSAIIHGNN